MSATAGDYDAGKAVTLTLNMSEAVNVTGTPTLTLNDGGTATYTGGTGTSALSFSYTVGAGQNTAGLAVTGITGTIADLAGNALSTANLPETFAGVSIDTTTPSVSSIVTSGTGITGGTGDLAAGSVVTLTLNMSEAVNVTGTPTLTLNDGGSATYTGGTGTNALTFSYTVGAGQNTPDLTVTGITGTIAGFSSNTANLTGAVTNPAGTLKIDTTTPSVTSVVASGTGITAGAGDLAAGSVVTLTVNLSEAVTVAGGTPTLTLNDGGTATYTGGTGSSALTFSYTVAAGQNTPDLAVTAVNLSTATIADLAGSPANLAGVVAGPAGTLQIDTSAPTLNSIVESPASGDLKAGKTVTLTLNLSEAVTVAGGTPTLLLNDGGTATYAGGSGTGALTFSHTVAAGQDAASLTATAINLNGATIKDGAGNVANLSTLSSLIQSGPQIDTTIPAVTQVVAVPANGTQNPSATITFTVDLSKVVTVSGTPTLTLNDGGTAIYTGGTGTDALTFSYTVAATDNTVPALAITQVNLPAGATVMDAAGNAADLSGALTTFPGLAIDPPPTLLSIAESPAAGDLNAGKTVTLTLNLNDVVMVAGGIPTLTLNDGGTAFFTTGSGTKALIFSYMAGAGDNTANLAATAVNLNGATVQDSFGNAASLSLNGLNQNGPQIDTTGPMVATLSAAAGDYDAGKTLALTLNTSEAVNVTGTPTLTLNDGGTATYTGGTGTTALTFSYTTSSGQNTAGLAVTAVNGTLTDLAGNALSSANLPETFTDLIVDTAAPTVVSVVTSGAGISAGTGNLGVGSVVSLRLNMSELVNVTGAPTLTLNDGGSAIYTGGTGTSALTFSYTVAAGQNTPDLTVTGVNLNSATIKDDAGNSADLSGAVTNPTGTLQINTAPASVAANNQSVAPGQQVALSSLFSISGNGITQYKVWFSHPEGGNPALGTVTNNGTPIALDQPVTVSKPERAIVHGLGHSRHGHRISASL